jgi:SAM-dependent methyltransferase
VSRTQQAPDFDIHVAEIHDQVQTGTTDADLILRLIGDRGPLRILEPFCGTGRILIHLAIAGHEMVGIDQAATMLDRCRLKVAQLPADVQQRITLIDADATASPWPGGFDVVVLGGNCFYELAWRIPLTSKTDSLAPCARRRGRGSGGLGMTHGRPRHKRPPAYGGHLVTCAFLPWPGHAAGTVAGLTPRSTVERCPT